MSFKSALMSSAVLKPVVDLAATAKRNAEVARYIAARDSLMTGPRATPPRWKKIRKVLKSDGVGRALFKRHAPLWQHENALNNKPIFGKGRP
jgi:hypothetical protein